MSSPRAQDRTVSRWQKVRPADVLLSRSVIGIAWFGIVLGVFLPPGAKDIPVCFLRAQTEIPCLACGMTRSISHAFRGDFEASLAYHPFGLVATALLVMIALVSLLPTRWRESVRHSVNRFPLIFFSLSLLTLLAFVGFGITRALQHILT